MVDVLQFALFGIGIGAAYTLSALGLVVIHRGSGVVNFAQGAIASAAAFVTWRELYEHRDWPFLAAAVVGVLLATSIGVATQLVVMQVLRRASALARTVATLGVFVMVQSYLGQVYGNDLWLVLTPLPDGRVDFGGGVFVPQDRLWLAGIAVVVTVALWAMYRWTNFGRATTAVAESQEIASSLGWSPNLIAAVNWGLGCGLAGLAGILITPIIGLNVGALTNLILASLAAALAAGFRSLPITLLAGFGLGILKSELTRFLPELGLPDEVDLAGLPDTAPFLLIIVILLIRGRALPDRGFVQERLPRIGTGRIRPGVVVVLTVALALAILQISSPPWQGAVIGTMGLAVILLSAVVIVGYAGQISLAQFALAGFGAWVAARLIVDTGMPFELATLLAILSGFAIGVIFAFPATRVRGVSLAIITFGLATAMHRMLFANVPLTGGRTGLDVGSRSIFGIDIDPIKHQERYAAFGLVVFALVAIVVANVRRGRVGRRLIAVRANERAAAALGISSWAVKVYAFGLSAAIAALGGVLLVFKTSPIVFEFLFPARSITVLTTAVIGGIGYVLGPLIGALWLPGSLGARFVDDILGVPTEWLAFVGGAFVLLIIMRHQDGAANTFARAGRALGARIAKVTDRAQRYRPLGPLVTMARRLAGHTAAGEIEEIQSAGRGVRKHRVTPRRLEIRDLTVTYGGITALKHVDLVVEPGLIVGLIGPNGAGKTTLVDAVTGFVDYTGEVTLDGRRLDGLPAHKRARAGVTRSFQNLEIFEDLTVAENLRTASDPGGALPYLADLVYPKHLPLSEAALACIDEFNVGPLLGQLPTELSYGQRRLVAIARAVAAAPSVLVLDEPASGLVEWSSMELAMLVRRLATEWGMGIVVIEHDIRFVMTACDSVMALDFGEEIAFGSPESVRHDPAVIAAYLGDVEQLTPERGGARSQASTGELAAPRAAGREETRR